MTAHSLRLDHLVISARTLDEGTQYVADTLGVAPAGGGAHPLMRTHNRLLNLWGGVYLEVIAIDPQAAAPADGAAPRARLFALDDPATHARLENGPVSVALGRASGAAEAAARCGRRNIRSASRPIVPMTRGDFTLGPDGARRRRVPRVARRRRRRAALADPVGHAAASVGGPAGNGHRAESLESRASASRRHRRAIAVARRGASDRSCSPRKAPRRSSPNLKHPRVYGPLNKQRAWVVDSRDN